MGDSKILYDILVFLVAAVVVVPAFQRMRTSPIIGYLVAGVLVGPHGFAFIRDAEGAHTLAEFGVVFLLFMVGLELSVARLRALGRYVFGLGALQVIVTGSLIGFVAWSLGMSEAAAITIGGGLALSSTAFVLKLLIDKGERESQYGNIAFAVLLFQDLAIVPLLMLVTLLGEGSGSLLQAIGLASIKAALALIVIIGSGRLVLRPIYRVIAEARNSELFVATTLLVVLGTGWLLSLVGISMVLGAFLAGLLLSETEFRHQVEADIRPFRGILLGLFFMTVGMSINITFIQSELALIALIVAGVMVGKSIVTAVLCRVYKLPVGTSVRVGLLLSQGGEFGFILFITASSLGLLSPETTQLLLASVTLTMVATPAMSFAGNQLSNFLSRGDHLFVTGTDKIPEDLHDHILIAGFGRVGQTVAKILSAACVPYIALDMDASRIKACRSKGLPVFFGDTRQIEILTAARVRHAKGAIVTIDEVEAADLIIHALHESIPNLPIFARASDMLHSRRLEKGGATQAIPETLEASIQLGTIAVTSLGLSEDEAIGITQELRKDDYASLGDIISG